MKSQMRLTRTSGSVGGLGGQPPRSTRPVPRSDPVPRGKDLKLGLTPFLGAAGSRGAVCRWRCSISRTGLKRTRRAREILRRQRLEKELEVNVAAAYDDPHTVTAHVDLSRQ